MHYHVIRDLRGDARNADVDAVYDELADAIEHAQQAAAEELVPWQVVRRDEGDLHNVRRPDVVYVARGTQCAY